MYNCKRKKEKEWKGILQVGGDDGDAATIFSGFLETQREREIVYEGLT